MFLPHFFATAGAVSSTGSYNRQAFHSSLASFKRTTRKISKTLGKPTLNWAALFHLGFHLVFFRISPHLLKLAGGFFLELNSHSPERIKQHGGRIGKGDRGRRRCVFGEFQQCANVSKNCEMGRENIYNAPKSPRVSSNFAPKRQNNVRLTVLALTSPRYISTFSLKVACQLPFFGIFFHSRLGQFLWQGPLSLFPFSHGLDYLTDYGCLTKWDSLRKPRKEEEDKTQKTHFRFPHPLIVISFFRATTSF